MCSSDLEKIRRVAEMVGDRNIEIEVDGGVTPETAGSVAEAGATVLVAGSAVFRNGPTGYAEAISDIRAAAEAGAARRGR